MSILSDLSERLRALFSRRRLDHEMDEELRFHLDREKEERIKNGEDPEAARRAAAVAFGGLERTKDEVRESRGVQALEDLVADARYALRALAHNPGFTIAAVLVLGLGIGAATAVFSTVRGVLLEDLPFQHPDRLVRVYWRSTGFTGWQLSTVDAQAIVAEQRSFEAFGVVTRNEGALSGVGAPTQIPLRAAQSGFFRALGIRPVAGRLIEPADEIGGAPPVAVVTHAMAVNLLGGPAAAVDRQITIDGVSYSVVGVLPPGRDELAGMRASVWLSLKLPTPTRRGPFWLRGYARLKEGVSAEQARSDLEAIGARVFPIWQAGFRDSTARYTSMPLRESIVGNARQQLDLFAGAVALVLLIAIANVATLVLVRASAREHELQVRTALGAGTGRLARLLVAENLVLTALAGALGIGFATLGLAFLTDIAPRLPRAHDVGLGLPAVLFAVAVSVSSGLLIGITPVASVLGRSVTSLRSESGRTGVRRRTTLVRNALVTLEFALALPLLLGAGELLNSFLRLQGVDPGYESANVMLVNLALPPARYRDSLSVAGFLTSAVRRAEETPGVIAAGISTDLPPDNGGNNNNFNLPDHPVAPGQSEPVVPWSQASAGFFKALSIPLVAGRMFDRGDSATAPLVVVVSRSWAEHYFKGESPLGRRIISGGCYSCPPTTIVGVVGDVKYKGLASDGEGVYEPVSQGAPTLVSLVVKASAPPVAVFPELKRGLAALDPQLPLAMVTMDERIAESVADPRRWTSLLSAFAVAAALLAAIGIFGLMSFVVRQRRREIGVRLALGAEPASVTRMIVARGMRYAMIGMAIGVGISLFEARWLRALLFEVAPTDPVTLAGAVVLLLLTALLACWLPGLRAARIKPLEAIASE
ncbi:MAG: ADOP family duplicated permease [Gemmatimonadales bacterium]